MKAEALRCLGFHTPNFYPIKCYPCPRTPVTSLRSVYLREDD